MGEERKPRQLDYLTKYATAAIRFHASEGGLDAWKQKHLDELMITAAYRKGDDAAIGYIQGGGIADPTFAAFSWSESERADDKTLRDWMDLQAVEQMYGAIARLNNPIIRRRCVELVYAYEPNKYLQKGEITDRVYHTSALLHFNTSDIWVYLKDARLLFARARGLRLEDWHYEYLRKLRWKSMGKNIVQGSD